MTNVTPLNAGATGTKTCVVCCKLPHGLILESGYSFTTNGAVVRSPEYKRVKLAGSNQSTLQLAAQNPGLTVVSRPHFRAGITINVDEAFFDKWVKDHADSNIVKNRQIWKCKSLAEAQGQARDDTERTSGVEPLAQTKREKDSGAGTGFTPPTVSDIEPRTEEV
jgi:hypothetical protein